ncbi:hypothetical protein O6H91_16G090500 [Diphasiastrum complanatum]|uniref:Uncharacterized protein n=1 Tax=Diphasiastrum complanatum TaxID=34168 RepID=A0ACC2BFH6_DIPCM|nr:hypothetical protein O6H91_16G090500 [Diphasiastrum complanatum]
MAFLAACGGDTIKLFDVRGGETGGGDPYTLQYAASLGLHINCAHWNHTNLVEASAGEDRKISLWLKSGRPLGTVPSNEGAPDIVEANVLLGFLAETKAFSEGKHSIQYEQSIAFALSDRIAAISIIVIH